MAERRPGMGVTPLAPGAEAQAESFAASRWTQGNFLFPTRLVVSPLRVSRVKSRWFGSNDESIAISKIASVHISTGVLWAEIRIESTGGTDPITSHGHRKADAQRIRDLIETYQAQSRDFCFFCAPSLTPFLQADKSYRSRRYPARRRFVPAQLCRTKLNRPLHRRRKVSRSRRRKSPPFPAVLRRLRRARCRPM
jgi:hypothetical protein